MDQKGFTLIELMIVVAIIGILAAVAVPKFAEMLRKSKEGATKGSLTNLRSVLTIYISDNEGLVPLGNLSMPSETAFLTAMIPKYIDVIPTAKLGQYHTDSSDIEWAYNSDRGDLSVYPEDRNGWIFTSSGGGVWWVNCTHSDVKNQIITSW